jgi:hypothetical protein
MRPSTRRLVALLTIGALAVVACGGGDDDSTELGDVAADASVASDNASSSDDDTSADGDGGASSEAGFGEFVSGEIIVTGDEDLAYSVGDPSLDFISGGGCLDGTFGIVIQPRQTDTGFSVMQLSAEIDEDLSGGATGTYPVEDISLLVVTDTDFGTGPTYRGPGTMVVSEHDTGAATDPNSRRMAITFDGKLAGSPSGGGGEVEVSADVVWVMGCP